MSGHFPPEIGRTMEDEFAYLLERLGYKVLRKRDLKSGIDVIANFQGEPIPSPPNKCTLIPPLFSPPGITAFSLKRGEFGEGDVNELLRKIENAQHIQDDETLHNIKGSVIVTNYTKTEDELDKLLSRSVYCWDIKRLLFYSTKARITFQLAQDGPVREFLIENVGMKSSYLMETGEKIGSDAISIYSVIFIDDHRKELMVSSDHIVAILQHIYEKYLRPIVDSTHLDVQTKLQIHILGIAHRNLIENAYLRYARDQSLHPRVVFAAVPLILQYGAAPWAALLQL